MSWGVRVARTCPAEAPCAQCPGPDRGSGRGALQPGRPPHPGADKALGWGSHSEVAVAGQVGQTRVTRGSHRQGAAALTWMVQVYSLSSSSRTVQLYSRSRLLLLPLINLLSIFPPARPRERRGGAADPRGGATQPGSCAPNPGTCTITTAGSPPLPPAGPTPPSPPSPPPPPPAQTKRRTLSPRCPNAGAQLVGRGLGRRGPNGSQRGGTEWQAVQPIDIVY